MLLVVCFTWVDPKLYLDPPSGYPFLEQFMTATGSANGAIAITSIMILLTVLSLVNFMASTSRQVFAFARDDGLPFSRWISTVNKRTLTPMNALVVVLVFVVLICLIGLGSTVLVVSSSFSYTFADQYLGHSMLLYRSKSWL